MKKHIQWEIEWQRKWLSANEKAGDRNLKKTSKKFIEYLLRGILRKPYKVLKRNPGHITLCEVSIMPDPDTQEIASRLCGEKIVFVLRDEFQAILDQNEKSWQEWEEAERKRLNKKTKKEGKGF